MPEERKVEYHVELKVIVYDSSYNVVARKETDFKLTDDDKLLVYKDAVSHTSGAFVEGLAPEFEALRKKKREEEKAAAEKTEEVPS